MTQYQKLPNGEIVSIDQNGYFTRRVSVDLSAFIDHDLEGVLDLLSEEATGSCLLSDISYTVVGHTGNTIDLDVTGHLEDHDDPVDPEILPMKEFEVQVTRIGYGSRTVRLSARTLDEARQIADDDAGNHAYSEHCADYAIEAYEV